VPSNITHFDFGLTHFVIRYISKQQKGTRGPTSSNIVVAETGAVNHK